jgi:phosphoserine phosphatase
MNDPRPNPRWPSRAAQLVARLRGLVDRLAHPAAAGARQAAADHVSAALPAAAPAPLPARATVVIPALNEARRIASVVAYALADPATAEVIVIDDSSTDDTAELARQAGARVLRSTMLGKGASMKDGVAAAGEELLVFLDGDLAGLRPGIVSDLVAPLASGAADFVKARFGRSGGRVTELTAKPMLKVFFPELAHFGQPLGGLIAARRTLLRSLPFEDGYGVDIGLLIDAHRAGAHLAEVDIGSLEHDSQPLLDLAAMANEVSRVIYSRARAAGRLHVEQIGAMFEAQRQAAAGIDSILARRRGRTKLLLLSMDGTVIRERFAQLVARGVGKEAELIKLLGELPADRHARIAALMRFVHREQFERVAREVELRAGVIPFVNRMRRAGFMVGLVSDSWFIAAEIVRRRIFADFALAHMLQFDGDVCTGELRMNPAFRPDDPGTPEAEAAGPALCKSHVLRRFRADPAEPRLALAWALGDNVNDLGLLRAADRAFALPDAAPEVRKEPNVTVVPSFDALLAQLPGEQDGDTRRAA